MLVLLTIFLFLLIPLVMLLFYLVRPKFNVQGFLAVLAVIAGWILVFLARSDMPANILLQEWKPTLLFDLSPSLLVDNRSWYFALAIASLVLAVVITSIAQHGQSAQPDQDRSGAQIAVGGGKPAPDIGYRQPQPITTTPGVQPAPGWLAWASMLVFSSLGLLAVISGNILTLLLAWAALDFIELVILLGQMPESKTRERIILAFAARMAGICVVLIAGMMAWTQGLSLAFDDISRPISTVLVIAAGLRLGVLPIHRPLTSSLPIGRNFGTVLRLIQAISSYILLVRVSSVGVVETVAPYLLGLIILAGIYGAINWLRARDEIEGRSYWIIGISSLAVASAILNQPSACLAWSITGLLSGGFIFCMFLRHKNMVPLILLGLINLSALPFSPSWQGTALYQYTASLGINLTLFALFSFFLILTQAFLMAGFILHALQGIFPILETPTVHSERWVWFLYPFGLMFIMATQLLIGWLMVPNLHDIPLSGWIMGPVVLIISGVIFYFYWHSPQLFHLSIDTSLRTAWDSFFSLEWLYRLLWRSFQLLSKIFSLVSAILEGDGGLLWALVLFALIFVFLQR
jgi:hypothetical protein